MHAYYACVACMRTMHAYYACVACMRICHVCIQAAPSDFVNFANMLTQYTRDEINNFDWHAFFENVRAWEQQGHFARVMRQDRPHMRSMHAYYACVLCMRSMHAVEAKNFGGCSRCRYKTGGSLRCREAHYS